MNKYMNFHSFKNKGPAVKLKTEQDILTWRVLFQCEVFPSPIHLLMQNTHNHRLSGWSLKKNINVVNCPSTLPPSPPFYIKLDTVTTATSYRNHSPWELPADACGHRARPDLTPGLWKRGALWSTPGKIIRDTDALVWEPIFLHPPLRSHYYVFYIHPLQITQRTSGAVSLLQKRKLTLQRR